MKFKCKYCDGLMIRSPESYAGNPFCSTCLPQRMAEANAKAGPTIKYLLDGMVHTVPVKDLIPAEATIINVFVPPEAAQTASPEEVKPFDHPLHHESYLAGKADYEAGKPFYATGKSSHYAKGYRDAYEEAKNES